MTTDYAPRVVIADDSAFMRKLISDVLTRAGMDVVALVANGREALDACERLRPDVLSLDLAMPELDGMQVLRTLKRNPEIRVVVVSSFTGQEGARAVDALTEGAFDLVPKNASSGKLQDFLDDLLGKVTAAAAQSPKSIEDQRRAAATVRAATSAPARRRPITAPSRRLVVIAASTGGPRALTTVAEGLPAKLGHGVIIVQHMPSGFTQSLATRLDAFSEMKIAEAEDAAVISPDRALVAPGGRHLRIRNRKVALSDEPPVAGLRPCADITIGDAVAAYGASVVLAVLTGMGRDGAYGARLVHEAGGVVIAEHASTCTVHGMPKAVSDAGLADEILPIEEIAAAITEAAGGAPPATSDVEARRA